MTFPQFARKNLIDSSNNVEKANSRGIKMSFSALTNKKDARFSRCPLSLKAHVQHRQNTSPGSKEVTNLDRCFWTLALLIIFLQITSRTFFEYALQSSHFLLLVASVAAVNKKNSVSGEWDEWYTQFEE